MEKKDIIDSKGQNVSAFQDPSSSTITAVDPASLFTDGYELSNSVITTQETKGSFIPTLNTVEFYIYDSNKNLIISEYNFREYSSIANARSNNAESAKTGKIISVTDTVSLSPEIDVANRGFNNGNLYAVYNFINLELGSNYSDLKYYIAEISSDRTEIRIKSNRIQTSVMRRTFLNLSNRLSGGVDFDEFYISFGRNEYHIGVNIKYDDSVKVTVEDSNSNTNVKPGNTLGQSSILIKLFDPLPLKYKLESELYVATKPAESQGFLVSFPSTFSQNPDNLITLKGPNSNLKINDFVNDSSIYKNKNKLLETKSTGSRDQLLNRLSQKGITLDVNYSTGSFNDYVNFSSANARVSNFVEKVSRIHAYESDINVISSTTASNPSVTQISESIASLYTKIESEIVSFDGFDYYQYYSTGSDAYPKTGSVFPLQLQSTESAASVVWINASLASASLYDEDNQNWLYYTVPDFIKSNSSNNNYLEFVNMTGQSFDEMWLYTKAIAEKNNTTNQFDKGIALELADDVITSLGYTGYGNNYNNQDNFIGLIGNDNGNYVPPTGSELINHYIAINGPGGIQNYWEDLYSYEDYVEQILSTGFPYPIDKVSKEIFKRLYHNMSYLVKKKGTISGLRQLINIWGIPNTILRINEFGGKNKDEEDDYDLWYQRYSYAYTPVPSGTNYASSSVRIPWQPLYRNYIESANKPINSQITANGSINNGTGAPTGVSANYDITTQFIVTGGGTGGQLSIASTNGVIIFIQLFENVGGSGYTPNSVITITGDQINNLNDPILGQGWSGTATFPLTIANLGAEEIVPDGLGFRFKTTGYPSSSYGGNYTSQSLFVKKSTNASTDADFGIVLNYTGSTSGSGAGNTGPTYLGGTSSAYKDYGEMRFWIKGSELGGDTALSPPIYLPFFDKGWWTVQLQRDEHPIVAKDDLNTTYTLYVANKIYDGNDGNQIGFQGSASIYVNVDNAQPGKGPTPHNFNANSASVNASWNAFSLDLAQYGAGAYVGGWGNTLTAGSTGSMGILASERILAPGQPLGNKGVQRAGDNFSGSLQEFRYYSNDISQSVFNDAVMNPESIEGNFITGSESSFDIVNFRAPLGNELEHIFTASYATEYIEQLESMHPAITGSSPLVITASFWNPAFNPPPTQTLTSSYDVTYNVNSSTKTYSDTNVETYFLDQPSIGIRNRVSNKIKTTSNLNFGNTLSNKVSIQQDPPVSQSYTDNINLLEVAFSPTEEVNDDIIQTLGYGSIQEVIADPRFRSSSDDYYPGLRSIAKDYFKKYTNRSQIDYLRLIKYFDDSLFRAIKNYVPARTSVSTGIVIKQNMLERSRYREPQVDIVTTQSYAPFNKPLTAINLELTGSIKTHQLWDPIKQTTYYSSSDVFSFEGGAGGSVNQYNVLEEGGGLFMFENDNFVFTNIFTSILEAVPVQEVSKDIVYINAGLVQNQASATITFGGGQQNATNVGTNIFRDSMAIKVQSLNPDGTTLIKTYCSAGALGYAAGVDMVLWKGNVGLASTKAASFVDAVNSANGQGSGASQGTEVPTLTAIVDPGNNANVILTQLYGGTDGNLMTITYGSELTQVGTPLNSGGLNVSNLPDGTNYPATGTSAISGGGTGFGGNVNTATAAAGLTVTYSTTGNVVAFISSYDITAANDNYNPGATITLTDGDNNAQIAIAQINPTVGLSSTGASGRPALFSGGTVGYENIFLNALKSLRTPIYLDFDFDNFSTFEMSFQVSSSIRGIILTNTTEYTQANPPGSTLLNTSGEQEFIEMHPGEDIYFKVKELLSPNIIAKDYQIILGENIIITNSLAVGTTSNSTTAVIDNFDEYPPVDSIVTGPDVRSGVVTTLGAVTNGGTGYTPGVSVLATTGAGGGNLTLTVTTNANGIVTTAAISGAANPGTGYTSGDIVTIVGGDNNAKVAITVATPRPARVTAFDITTNTVTFNSAQSIANNTKVIFTVTNVIPDADTIPVSQQGNFNYNITPLGVDTTWDSTQEQFYDGEFSGSNLSGEQYYNNQYNPYRKVKPNSIPSLSDTVDPVTGLPVAGVVLVDTVGTYVSESTGPIAAIVPSVAFNNFQPDNDGFDYTNTYSVNTISIHYFISSSIIPGQNYLLTYDINQTTAGSTAGQQTSGIQNVVYILDEKGSTISTDNGIGMGNSVGAFNVTGIASAAISHSFVGANVNVATNYRDNNRFVPVQFQMSQLSAGTVRNIRLTGIGEKYNEVQAPIFFTRQDEGYDNQKDYQNMTDGSTITDPTFRTIPIELVQNTQSVIFNNSDYNPIVNNANIIRSSTYRYLLDYGFYQNQPSNFLLVVTQSYFPTSPSGTFPQKAEVPDSNYTMHGSINGRYAGTKLSSFTYNFNTPSGSIGPTVQLPIQPVNALGNGINSKGTPGFKVAPEFLDGSTTSSFDQTLLGEGKPSWGGDSRQYNGRATIDKHPIYMARFENSYEQLNLYNSYQYNIDQLIEIPFEDIAGQEITPNSITIDGSNENKKVVSAAFESKRKASVSYLNPKTRTVDYTQMQVGNFDILSGATEFLTINSNAKSRVSASLAYQYTLGGIPPTGSRPQYQNTIQMVTGSNTFPDTSTAGVIDSILLVNTTTNPITNATGQGTITLTDVPLTSLGGSGAGALATVIFASNGTYTSTTITSGGQGYSDGNSLQISANTLASRIASSGFIPGNNAKAVTVSRPLNFLLAAAGITTGGILQTSYGFLLSGSLTTDVVYGGNFDAEIASTLRIGDPSLPINPSIFPQDYRNVDNYPSIYYNATPAGTYNDLVTSTNGNGTGMTVKLTIIGNNGLPNDTATTGQPVFGALLGTTGTGYTPGSQQILKTTRTSVPAGDIGVTVKVNVDQSGNLIPLVGEDGVGGVANYIQIENTGDGTTKIFDTFNIIQAGASPYTTMVAVQSPTSIKSLKIINPGQGYIPGDKIIVENTTLIAAGITPTGGGLDIGRDYISRELTLSDLTPLTNPYSVNFNPSPISSSTNASIFSPPTVPERQQLLIGGPQLALHHMYNTTISSSYYEINPTQVNFSPDRGPQSLLWTTSGSEASNVENYMIWNPDGSDSTSYQNTTTPFLIERGDIIRVEGITNTINSANISQSTAIVEDFTVEEIQNYAYSSSFNATYTNARNVFPATGFLINGNPATFSPPASNPAIVNIGVSVLPSSGINFFGFAPGNIVTIGTSAGVYSSNNNTSGTTVVMGVSNTIAPDWGWYSISLTGGYGWEIGEIITISVEALTTAANWSVIGNAPASPSVTVFTADIVLQVTPQMLTGTSFNNDFTFGVDINAPNTTNEPGSVVGYNQYGIGDVGFVAPTFVRVEPDPRVVLNGLEAGAVTKMTVRRQIEADDRIMLKNITPPSGSRGVATPSGQGFIIPNDFSKVQKSNALNIINQLKAKNAFDKPIEPGITKD